MKFYSLHPEDKDNQGIACAPEGLTFELLYRKTIVENWLTIEFELKNGGYTDYQGNNLRWHLCSDSLRRIISSTVTEQDDIQWLPLSVRDQRGDVRTYYILHLTRCSDVLHDKHTIRTDGLVVKPVLDLEKTNGLSIFKPSMESVRIYVSQLVKRQITAARISGIKFIPAPVS